MHTLIIPYDFSAASDNAVSYAMSMFDNKPTHFVFVHCLEFMGGIEITSSDHEPEEMKALEEAVSRFENAAAHQAHRFSVEVLRGDITRKINALALTHRADALFMGTRGKGNSRQGIIGSTTAAVIEHARLPVMAIPQLAEYTPFRRIVLATDFMPIGRYQSFDYLMRLLSVSSADFVALNVESPGTPVTMERTMAALTFDKYFENRPIRYDFVANDNNTKGILEYIDEQEADLLAMLRRDHRMLRPSSAPSVVDEALMEIPVPLLALPELK